MARNDYVKTITGVQQRGGDVITALLLGAGRSISEAADALQDSFPRLSRATAYEAARNQSRRMATQERRAAAGLVPAQAALLPQAVPGLPVSWRYLAVVTYVHPLTGATQVMSHWVDSQTPLSFDEVQDRVRSMEGIVHWTRDQSGSPGAQVETHDIESITVSRVQTGT